MNDDVTMTNVFEVYPGLHFEEPSLFAANQFYMQNNEVNIKPLTT